MSFRLNPDEAVRHGLKRIVRRQLRRAHRSLQENGEDRVHEARKSVKKVRAIVRLLREAEAAHIGKDERRLRAAGRVLSRLRDADAVLTTLDLVKRRFPKRLSEHTAALIRRELIRIKTQITKETRTARRVARAARELRTARRSVDGWAVPELTPLDVVDLVKIPYRASRKAMRKVRKTTRASDLHRWRKRVKMLWYQLRLLEGQAPALRTMIQRLDRLETVLGQHHDLFVLQSILARRRPAAGVTRQLTALSRQFQTALRRRALEQGRRLLDDKPKSFARAVRRSLSQSSRRSQSSQKSTSATSVKASAAA
jgi:CHAD domain-containing protein